MDDKDTYVVGTTEKNHADDKMKRITDVDVDDVDDRRGLVIFSI
jgi:hypothetical protein